MSKGTCSAESCEVAAFVKGMCQPHYNRAYYAKRFGEPAPEATECLRCGGELPPKPPKGPRASYCSKICQSDVHRERQREYASEQRMLRPPLHVRVPPRSWVCLQCGAGFEARRGRMFCSKPCQRRYRRLNPLPATKFCERADCDRPAAAKGLCKVHYKAMRREAGLESNNSIWTDTRRDNYHRRRARRKAVSSGEPVRLADIAERDGFRCGLCHRKVNMALVWPHKRSPSLDHIVPLSVDGGWHDPVNVQLAHLGCNVQKGAQVGEVQLAMIG